MRKWPVVFYPPSWSEVSPGGLIVCGRLWKACRQLALAFWEKSSLWDCLFIAMIWSNFIRRERSHWRESWCMDTSCSFHNKPLIPDRNRVVNYSVIVNWVLQKITCAECCAQIGAQVARGSRWDARCLSCVNQSDSSRWRTTAYEGAPPRSSQQWTWLTDQPRPQVN